jgi:tripartite-type tricarboxylate transporter receptor subunit TctC
MPAASTLSRLNGHEANAGRSRLMPITQTWRAPSPLALPSNGTHPAALGLAEPFARLDAVNRAVAPPHGGPAMQDLLAGQIDMMFAGADTALPQVRAATIKAYAVMAKDRLMAAPDIPTIDEAGLPGLYQTNWYALFAPKGTPKNVISRLNTAIVDSLADPAVRQRFDNIEQKIPALDQQTPEALGALQKVDIEKWWPVVKAAGIKAE